MTSTGRDSIASSSSSSTLATSVGASSLDSLDSTHSSAGRSLAAGLTEEEISFCSRFQLSPEETPLSWWCAGRRCSLLDRSRPLSLTKSGKLYLTHRYMYMCMCMYMYMQVQCMFIHVYTRIDMYMYIDVYITV